MPIESYKELIVWQKSMELVKEIYRQTDKLPKSELFVLTSQMRRSAISLPSNIAEGYKRRNLKEYIHFLSIADASAAELETQMLLVKDLYPEVALTKAEILIIEVQKMLVTLTRKLSAKNP